MTRSFRSIATRLLVALPALALLGLTSCLGSSQNFEEVASEVRWIEPSPVLQNQIDDEIRRLPWTRGFERIEQIRWFASVGEPAYDSLLALVADPRDDVAAAALAALGATLDRRLVEPLMDVQWSDRRERSDLGFERARTLVRLGDWSTIPTLVDGLEDERVYTRTLCIEALFEATRQDLGFDPKGTEAERAAGIASWRSWWANRSAEDMLKKRR